MWTYHLRTHNTFNTTMSDFWWIRKSSYLCFGSVDGHRAATHNSLVDWDLRWSAIPQEARGPKMFDDFENLNVLTFSQSSNTANWKPVETHGISRRIQAAWHSQEVELWLLGLTSGDAFECAKIVEDQSKTWLWETLNLTKSICLPALWSSLFWSIP